MITLKSRDEIELMREAGRLVAKAHQQVREILKPGIKAIEIDAVVRQVFVDHDAIPLFLGIPGTVPFPGATCISINEQVVHGIPDDRELVEGDIVAVDTACRLNGWCADAAWTYPVGNVDGLKRALLEVGEETLNIAIREVGRCASWSQVASLMADNVRAAGFVMVEEFSGHGIGREMHEDPQAFPFVRDPAQKRDFSLEPGLVLAIEPLVNAGSKRVRVLSDHWTVVTEDGMPSVHFEHTVAVTAAGSDVLTQGVGSCDRA